VRAVIRLARFGWHILGGALTLLWVFPRLDEAAKERRIMDWAIHMLRIMGVMVEVRGPLPDTGGRGAVLAANHISWLDIHVLHSLLPVRFISKAEVQGWPVIGWLAQEVGTVFLVREKKSDAARVNQLMTAHLEAGDMLTFFPEGTTSDGRDVAPFYPSLFQPAVDAGAAVWPVRLRYVDEAGEPCGTAAYYGDMTLGQSLMRVARAKQVRVRVEFLPPIAHAPGRHRRDLARLCEAAIRWRPAADATPAERAAPDTAPENTAHPPA